MFNRKLLRQLVIIAVLGSLLAAVFPLSAQDGLTPEQIALLQDVVGISDVVQGYQTYIEQNTEIQNSTVRILQDTTIVQDQTTTETRESTTAYIRGENPNAYSLVTVTVEDLDTGRSVVQGDVRYVNGMMYASATVLEGTPETQYPAGFVAIADPTTDETFSDFDVEGVFNSLMGIQNENNPLNNLELLQSVVTAVTMEVTEWEGAPATVITVTIPGSNLYNLMTQLNPENFENPTTVTLFGFMSADSNATLRLYRDAANTPLSYEATFNVFIPNVDMSTIDPTVPAGLMLDMSLIITQESRLSSINQPLEPVAVPQ